jgi:hypothetical protein
MLGAGFAIHGDATLLERLAEGQSGVERRILDAQFQVVGGGRYGQGAPQVDVKTAGEALEVDLPRTTTGDGEYSIIDGVVFERRVELQFGPAGRTRCRSR